MALELEKKWGVRVMLLKALYKYYSKHGCYEGAVEECDCNMVGFCERQVCICLLG